MFLSLICEVISSEAEFNVYKDGAFFNNQKQFFLADPETIFMIPDSLGTYKTVLNDSCGMDIAISVLSLCGKLIYLSGS